MPPKRARAVAGRRARGASTPGGSSRSGNRGGNRGQVSFFQFLVVEVLLRNNLHIACRPRQVDVPAVLPAAVLPLVVLPRAVLPREVALLVAVTVARLVSFSVPCRGSIAQK